MTIRQEVVEAAQKRLLFLPHAIRQMSRPERMISPSEVETVVKTGELIEDYSSRSAWSQLPAAGFRRRWPRGACRVFAERLLFGYNYSVSS